MQCNVEKADKELIFSFFNEFGMSYCQILSKIISQAAGKLREAGYDPNEEQDLEEIANNFHELMDSDIFIYHLIRQGFDKD